MLKKFLRKAFRRKRPHLKPKDKAMFAAFSVILTLTLLQLGLLTYTLTVQEQSLQLQINGQYSPALAATNQVLGAATDRGLFNDNTSAAPTDFEEPNADTAPTVLQPEPQAIVATDITDQIEQVEDTQTDQPPLEAPFKDVPANHPNYQAIQSLKLRGIVYNDPNLIYSPNSPSTRVGATTMVTRAAKIPDQEFTSSAFTDVQADNWFFNPINTAHRLRIVDTFEDGSFRPYDTLTQTELIALLVKAFNLDLSYYPAYTDNSDELYRVFALDNQLISDIKGDEPLTKAETAQIVFNTLSKFQLF